MQTKEERASTPEDVLEDIEYKEEYVIDEDYCGPVYPSQPCDCKRGVSYNPPGWKKVFKRKQDTICPSFDSKKKLFKKDSD